jgi:hypothetical protein
MYATAFPEEIATGPMLDRACGWASAWSARASIGPSGACGCTGSRTSGPT